MADIRIALAGNPNCGKTTLFNALTGSNQYVGNWAGVTVEKKEGKLRDHEGVIVTDLPGIYSLSPYSPEEVVARNYLIGERPDVILNIVDGTNLERNLYLTTQLAEIGIPVVVAVNMMDIVRKNGDEINFERLAKELGCEVVEMSALRGDSITEAAEAAIKAAKAGRKVPLHHFSGAVEHAIAHIEEAAVHDLPEDEQRWFAIKLFERDEKAIQQLGLSEDILQHIEKDIAAAEREMDDDAEAVITNERYNRIADIIKVSYKRKNEDGLTVSDRIDRIVTSRVLGLPVFAVIMFLVYYVSMVTVGASASVWVIDGLFGGGCQLFGQWIPGIPVWLGGMLDSIGCAEWLRSLILDGIVSGVGSVLGFVPQMLVLFLMLGFLESCGYMSRIAFVMDRLFRKIGLSGKSFIPILVGTGCGVPGIMASRTIENEHDRRMTVVTTTFIPCGAKVPVIFMIASAFFGGSALAAVSAYFLGMAAIIISGLILKKTKLFAGEMTPFVMELPAYHLPTLPNLLRTTWERGWSFIKKAGTVILISAVVIWFLSRFGTVGGAFTYLAPEQYDCSILAGMGKAIAWIFIPLGWGKWQTSVATLTGLVAKENIVSTMSVLYAGGNAFGAIGSAFSIDHMCEAVIKANAYEVIGSAFSRAAGYSFLAFNLLCAPCVAAMDAIRREMNSVKWTAFALGYQCVFAYLTAFVCYHLGSLLEQDAAVSPAGVVISVMILAAAAFLIFRKNPNEKRS